MPNSASSYARPTCTATTEARLGEPVRQMKLDRAPFIVTGAASGLGAATAMSLAGAGARVLLADLDAERGEAIAATLGRDGVHDLESFMRVLAVNVGGTFNMTRLAAAAMADGEPDEGGERGVVVCTASVAAFDGQIGQAAYAASKGGVAAMTLPLARELAGHGIRVVSIAPGIFDTPMLARMRTDVRESLGAAVPFPPRLGRP